MYHFLDLIFKVSKITCPRTTTGSAYYYGDFVVSMGCIYKDIKAGGIKAGLELIAEVREYELDKTDSERGDILFWLVYLREYVEDAAKEIYFAYEDHVCEIFNYPGIDKTFREEFDYFCFLDAFAKFHRSDKVRSKKKKVQDFCNFVFQLDLLTKMILNDKENVCSDFEYLQLLARQNYAKLTERHNVS
jgi:hypothetical protein